MVPIVKDNNSLSTQKLVSLLLKDVANEGRQENFKTEYFSIKVDPVICMGYCQLCAIHQTVDQITVVEKWPKSKNRVSFSNSTE